MSANYLTIKAKITAAMTALNALRLAKEDTAAAKGELAQIQANIANLAAYLADQQKILEPDEAAKNAAAARVNTLKARRQILQDQKATLIAERDAIQSAPSPAVSIDVLDAAGTGGPPFTGPAGSIAEAQGALDLADAHADYHDKALVLLNNDKPAGSNTVPTLAYGTLNSGAPYLNENAYVAVDGLAYLQAQRRDSEVNIKALRDSLAALEAERDRHTDPPQSLLDSITAVRGQIETENTALATINSNITIRMGQIANKISDVQTARQIVADKTQDKKDRQEQREQLVVRLAAKKAELRLVANELQNIEGQGTAVVGPPAVTAEDAVVPITSAPNGGAVAGSELDLAAQIKVAMDSSYATRQAMVDDLEDAKDLAESNLSSARAAVTTEEADEATAQADFDLKKQTLKSALDLQVTYEVNAAIRVLDAFLKLRSAVLSSAVTLDVSLQSDIDKTFVSSKVRSAYERIKGALTSPAEYRAVLAQIQADPVGFFFNNITDQDLSDLTPAEIERFKKEIRDKFRAEAAKVMARNGMGTTTPSTVAPVAAAGISLMTLLVILALAVLAGFVFVKVVLPALRK